MRIDPWPLWVAAFLFCLVVMGGIAGCGQVNKSMANLSGYSRVCVNNVSYLQFPSGVTVEYTSDGKVARCQ